MNAVEDYLRELEDLLRIPRRARRRLLSECREHLVESTDRHGEAEAVRRFGTAAGLAEAVHADVAARRAVGATVASALGVLGTGASALTLINAAAPGVHAVLAWALVFFAGAQAAAVCTVLAALQATSLRRGPADPAEVALLCRRNGLALTFALVTILAAGGAVPGHASAVAVCAGPVVAVLAAVAVGRARRVVRATERGRCRVVRPPLTDLAVLTHLPAAGDRPTALLGVAVAFATSVAFAWDRLDHGSPAQAAHAAGVEAGLVVLGLVILGPALGLRSSRRRASGLG